MKKIIFSSIAAILLIFIFVNWQKPPVEYVTITYNENKTFYWDSDLNKKIETSYIDEAMNNLSMKGFKFSSSTSSANNFGKTFIIIMAK